MRRALVVGLLLAAAAAGAAQPAADPPGLTAARFNAQLAVAYLKQNDVTTAREKIDKALAQYAHDSSVQLSAALVYERLQQPDKADRFFAEALRLDPHNPDMLNDYAVFQCRRGRYGDGQKLFEQAARSPTYATPEVAYTNAGVCARTAKDPARAEDYFRRALSSRPDFPDALLQLADLSFERGAALAARGLLDRYFRAAPATPEALYLGVRVERALGDADAAQRYSADLYKHFPDSEQARQLRGGGPS
jgi:type IV pilus assembly protein PilF